jgi:hypothetical protein
MFNIFCASLCVYLPERPGEGKRRNLNLCSEYNQDVNPNEKVQKLAALPAQT